MTVLPSKKERVPSFFLIFSFMSGEYNFINAEIKTGDQKLGRTEICPFYILAHSSVCVFKKKQKTEDLRKRSRAKRRPSFLDTTRPNFDAIVHPCLR